MEITWPYLAGFFDGEGSITYTHTSAPNAKRVIVQVVQAIHHAHVIYLIHKFLIHEGIQNTLRKRKSYKERARPHETTMS